MRICDFVYDVLLFAEYHWVPICLGGPANFGETTEHCWDAKIICVCCLNFRALNFAGISQLSAQSLLIIQPAAVPAAGLKNNVSATQSKPKVIKVKFKWVLNFLRPRMGNPNEFNDPSSTNPPSSPMLDL